MASCEPCSQPEEEPSSSGYPLDVVVDEEIPGPSAPWVDPSPVPPSPGQKRKREWSVAFEEETEEELVPDEDGAWVVETLCGLKMKLKRQRVSSVLPEHHEVFTKLLAPWVDPSPVPPSPGQKRKREWSVAFEEETEEELVPDEDGVWVVETLCGLKMKLKRQRVSSVLPEHHEVFTKLLEDRVVKRFLAWDKNLMVSDKYLLSMVIAYFSRAGLFPWQYRRIHFFIALYLASDMEEDNEAPKQAIFSFLYGRNRAQRPLFHKLRFQFFRSMGWKARVTREECEQIQAYDPELWVWGRHRTHIP
ncbi:speedy protein E4-like [Cynocephalus volans]|uniref:speedy protein E4-like n=1 Tax=Cynocephalus volans TaxID=110931 RepID=UPI002FC6B2D0